MKRNEGSLKGWDCKLEGTQRWLVGKEQLPNDQQEALKGREERWWEKREVVKRKKRMLDEKQRRLAE
jgi:hypothetical protein